VTAFDTVANESDNSNQAYASLRRKGDLTGGGYVDLEDFSIFVLNWQTIECGYCGGADLNGDGHVSLEDLLMLAENWLEP
jgi:hypothetical protein